MHPALGVRVLPVTARLDPRTKRLLAKKGGDGAPLRRRKRKKRKTAATADIPSGSPFHISAGFKTARRLRISLEDVLREQSFLTDRPGLTWALRKSS